MMIIVKYKLTWSTFSSIVPGTIVYVVHVPINSPTKSYGRFAESFDTVPSSILDNIKTTIRIKMYDQHFNPPPILI